MLDRFIKKKDKHLFLERLNLNLFMDYRRKIYKNEIQERKKKEEKNRREERNELSLIDEKYLVS